MSKLLGLPLYRRLPERVTNVFSHLVTPSGHYHPLHGTHTSTTLSASSAVLESTT